MNIRFTTLTILTLLLLTNSSLAQDTAIGVVYNDANKNGKFDKGEEPLNQVPVSNGRDVVLTDDEGTYELPLNNDTILFVIKPNGYSVPVDEHQIPQFFYIHKPDGSPKLKYSGVEPTGPLPESIDFGLYKEEQSDSFDILVFGDPQPYQQYELDYFDKDIIDELEDVEGFEFGITLGDIVGDDLDLFTPYKQSVARIGIPWMNVIGNHDMNYDAESDEYADERFEATFGPPTYSFNQGKVHFIVLDDVVYPRTNGNSGYSSDLTEKQLEFIENDLKFVPKDHLVVLAFHIPIFPNGGESERRLFDLIQDYPHTLSLSAHTHLQRLHVLDKERGWNGENPHIQYNVGTTSGDWWSGEPDEEGIPPTIMRDGTPNGYAKLSFEGNSFTIDYKVARNPASKKMNIWGPKIVPHKEWYNSDLYVNYFLGNDSTKVEFKVKEDTEWTTMQKVNLGDPFVTSLRNKWDTADELIDGKRPNNAIVSDHLWKAQVPKHLPEGAHTLTIRVTDMFGREFFDEYSYQIKDRKSAR